MNYGYHINNIIALSRKMQTISANSGFSRADIYQMSVDLQMEAQAIKDLIQKEDNDARSSSFSAVHPFLADNVYLSRGKE
jgi:hypothetical protein